MPQKLATGSRDYRKLKGHLFEPDGDGFIRCWTCGLRCEAQHPPDLIGQCPPRRDEKQPAGAPFHIHDRDAISITQNLRQMFAESIESVAPEVLRFLRNEVWPVYHECFRTAAAASPITHQVIESALRAGQRELYPELIAAISEWSKQFQLSSEWLIHQALDGMAQWSRESEPAQPEFIAEMLAVVGVSSNGLSDWRADSSVYHWSAGREWVRLPDQAFAYEAYAGITSRDEYRKRCISDFEAHLDRYLRDEACAYSKTPACRPSDYDLLALYLCRRWTPAQICDWLEDQGHPDGDLDLNTLERRIRAAAKSLNLPMRKSGRPKSPK